MLKVGQNNLYIYVVARDFGFAPNPFHGYCTLATCKPKIRNSAKVGDWIIGVGGSRLRATGKVIYALKITEITTFSKYWLDPRFKVKRPVRNGSRAMLVGDNIYHRDDRGEWIQEDSHHSNQDGTPNAENIQRDTGSENVIISNHFYYFGKSAKKITFKSIDYKNSRSHRKFPIDSKVDRFISALEKRYKTHKNRIVGFPFDFYAADKRVDQSTSKIS